MDYLQVTAIVIVAIIHIYIVYLEMVLWTTKKGIKIFGLKSKEFAIETKVMAANQGLYNGFLAAGILWFLFANQLTVVTFFLICVFIAGLYGYYSTKIKQIFYIQSIPALIAIICLYLNNFLF